MPLQFEVCLEITSKTMGREKSFVCCTLTLRVCVCIQCFAVRSLGWVEMAEDDLAPGKSSVAVNNCIRQLSYCKNDIRDTVGIWGEVRNRLPGRKNSHVICLTCIMKGVCRLAVYWVSPTTTNGYIKPLKIRMEELKHSGAPWDLGVSLEMWVKRWMEGGIKDGKRSGRCNIRGLAPSPGHLCLM